MKTVCFLTLSFLGAIFGANINVSINISFGININAIFNINAYVGI